MAVKLPDRLVGSFQEELPMPDHHAMLVFSNPVTGQEDDYLDWYLNRHIAEVASIDGVVAGRFYSVTGDADWGYVARYELVDPPGTVLERVYEANASGRMEIPGWITDVGAWIFAVEDSDGDGGWLAADDTGVLVLDAAVGLPDDVLRTRRLRDAGHPFDPAVPSPWEVVTDLQVRVAPQPGPGILTTTPLSDLVSAAG